MTFAEKLALRPDRLELDDCIRHSIQFIRFSKVYLKQKTADWEHEQHKGVSLIVFLFVFGVVFSSIAITVIAIVSLTLNPFISFDLLGNQNWYFVTPGIIIGFLYGFRFTISYELEGVNKTLFQLRVKERLKRRSEDSTSVGT